MIAILTVIVSCWLLFSVLKLSVRVAWGIVKVTAYALCILALPALIVCAITAGGLILLLPVALLAGAWGIMKCC